MAEFTAKPDDGWSLEREPDAFPGESLLRGKSPSEVLRKIMDDDPLHLAERCRDRVRAQALLFPLERLHARAAARVAYAAHAYRGDPALDVWLAERINVSLREMLREEREEERSQLPPALDGDARYAFLCNALGVEAGSVRRLVNAFNVAPFEVRAAFYSIAVEGKPFNRYVAEGNGPPERVRRNLKRALWILGARNDVGPDDLIDGGQREP